MKMLTRIASLIIAAALFSGCGSVISKGVLEGVDRNVSIAGVQAAPERFTDAKVLWGGVILATKNLEKATEVEVIETTLDFNDIPDFEYSSSQGRFIIRAERYLDPNIFKEGKGVTVAGLVSGVSVRKIGKMDYTYPVVKPIEMKLSEKLPEDYYSRHSMWGYPYFDPYDPYGPYYPFSPFGPTYPYGPYPYRRHPFYPYP